MRQALHMSPVLLFGASTLANPMIKMIPEQNFDFMISSHPNLTLIHNFFHAYSTNDLEVIRNILSDKIQWHIPGRHPLSGTKKGIPEVLAYFESLNKSFFTAEPIVMGVNDRFVIDCHRNESRIDKEQNFSSMSCLLWQIENNKIVEVYNFPQDQFKVDAFFTKHYR